MAGFSFRGFNSEEQRKLYERIAKRSNKQLLKASLVQAAFLVMFLVLLGELFGDPPRQTTTDLAVKLGAMYATAVVVWYLSSLYERGFAKRKLKELQK